MEENMIQEILTGPFSALVLAVTLLMGLYKLAAKYVPKVIEKHLEQMDEQRLAQKAIVDRLQEMHETSRDLREEDRDLFRKLTSGIHGRLNPIESDVKEIKAAVIRQAPIQP